MASSSRWLPNILVLKTFAGGAWEDEFLVVLKNVTASNHTQYLDAHLSYLTISYPNVTIKHVYYGLLEYNFIGYYAFLTHDAYNSVQSDPRVMIIESTGFVRAAAMVSYIPYEDDYNINLSLGDTPSLKNQCSYEYDLFDTYISDAGNRTDRGKGIEVYVLDTGIKGDLDYFDGRVSFGYNAIVNPAEVFIPGTDPDPNGHGTYVAGLIGGREGMAPAASLVDVRVLDADGVGLVQEVISGLEFVANELSSQSDGPKGIVHMSFSGKKSEALNAAIFALSTAALIVTAAGDEDDYSCMKSPGSATGVLNVAALDNYANFPLHNSNYGECIHVYAPGEHIPTIAITNNNSSSGSGSGSGSSSTRNIIKYRSGSSVAAAVVSGAATVVLGEMLSTNFAGQGSGNSKTTRVADSNMISALSSSAVPMLRAIMRAFEAPDARDPHQAPYNLCLASDPAAVAPIMRHIIRQQMSKKLASASLAKVRKTVNDLSRQVNEDAAAAAAAAAATGDKTVKPTASGLGDIFSSNILGALWRSDNKAGDSSGSSGVDIDDVDADASRKGKKTQAEIIEEAKKLKKKKKQNQK
eukprot:gene8488-17496_t